MADFNSKYSGEQVETMLDQIAKGEAGGGGGIAVETDPIFSASPAASITTEKISAWDDKEDKPIIFDAEKAGIEAGDGSEDYPGTFTPEQFQLAIGMTFAEFREAVLTGKRVVLRFGDSTIEPEAVYVTDDSIQVSYTKYTGLLGVALYCSTEYMTLSSALLTNSFYEIFYTKEEIDTNKQDKIADLDAIRSGAEKGATALQSVPSEYVTETELNDKGYLTSVPAEYVTETELTNKGYATTSDLDEKVDKISGKQLTTEDFTSALKTKLEGLSNYDDTELSDALSTLRGDFDKLVSGDTTTAIKSFNEVIAFLDGIQDTEDLSGIIASIEQQIAGKQNVIEGLDDINEKLEVINNIVDTDGYLYSNGEKVDMRFTRSLLPVGTSIPASANLNTIDYLKVGKYYCSLNVDAATVKNCPVNVAFSMEVFNPLGTNVDDETTGDYTYRLRVLTQYDTGQQYIQFCKTSGTAGSWTYNAWYVTPRVKFTLNSSKNDGSAAIGATNKGVYVDSTGEIKAMSYTVAKSVPSNAVFTDTNTKVTAVGNHYTPAEDTTQQIDAPSGEVVTGIKRDAAGHVVGVVTTPQSGGSGGGIAVETDPVFSASPAASITEDKKAEWDNKMDKVTLATVATTGSYNDLSNKPTIPSAVTESTVSGWGFTKNTGTVTKVKINGSEKTPDTNGLVDLGTIEGGGSSSGGSISYPVVSIGDTTASLEGLNPNTYYQIFGENELMFFNLTVVLNEPTDNSVVNEYVFEFSVPNILQTPSLSLPDTIIWANNAAPVIQKNKTYVVSIVNNLAVFAEF